MRHHEHVCRTEIGEAQHGQCLNCEVFENKGAKRWIFRSFKFWGMGGEHTLRLKAGVQLTDFQSWAGLVPPFFTTLLLSSTQVVGWKCGLCDQSFETEDAMAQHKEDGHEQAKADSVDTASPTCEPAMAICFCWSAGKCKRGDTCPFLHKTPDSGRQEQQEPAGCHESLCSLATGLGGAAARGRIAR